ncbi:Holliday junction branch migration protein RuvA [Campylobacter pinnipediorum]|uniref:Holliday junction branch migration complex subunit RuvA n=1 Tax=Campylobacter pinnipediorum subsp. pinnipediorum TaxID=1660067 RepID=A0AAX0LA85_9BACT|nr:Holliday junction branch migration protein RuvA [Campylobacter pinnipediorum]AQW80914.1 RuvABC resolvasome, subunit RuvA [Campylobacter pinnipediorum subsp. pinnipediorum]AQW82532.1 RuvABC resolvasome, subunit RuvA [Campylobacter pinnipediorum subsp. pinnipediorum]AQW84217.1 RuvABC resolvasome, subunit RuvA [Campylobacter pinnipediorum subsp. pinnipediorum]OPA77030.1 Holliday junction DNA helicase RuvA [Campylobacter pinnipediorum subsp. pinnipediorum]OPA78822.1 Holliday junction DNA helica
MIKAIEGVITKKDPAFVILKTVSGVSYGIFISLFCSAKLESGSKIELNITQIIREDANLFYGFLDLSEQKMFEMLVKLNGIGASTAMAICSSLNPNSFTNAILNGDLDTLKKVPGIGLKTARRIIAELSDANLISGENISAHKNEAIMALEALGFKKDKIYKVLAGIDAESMETGEIIKQALKKLG